MLKNICVYNIYFYIYVGNKLSSYIHTYKFLIPIFVVFFKIILDTYQKRIYLRLSLKCSILFFYYFLVVFDYNSKN